MDKMHMRHTRQSMEALIQQLLIREICSQEQFSEFKKILENNSESLLHYLISRQSISAIPLAHLVSDIFALPYVDLKKHPLVLPLPCPPAWLERYRLLPIRLSEHRMAFAIADPTDHRLFDEVPFGVDFAIEWVVVAYDALNEQLSHYLQQPDRWLEGAMADATNGIEFVRMDAVENVEHVPLVRLAHQLLHNAIERRASDIHLEPDEQDTRVRYRIDGVLQEVSRLPLALSRPLVARFKVLSHLDTAERRLPQDGRYYDSALSVDVRTSTCPTLHGEKIVMRLLPHTQHVLPLQNLGLSAKQYEIWQRALSAPQGLILVTGPTGSGKTITLYAALQALNQASRNIMTVEDPVEIAFPGIYQVAVNDKVGLNFTSALRALLRQDPDVMMIGEIRDLETAQIVLQAALTGHLVLSTLHTNQALEILLRIRQWGVDVEAWVSSLKLLVAQRLLRVLCVHCKKQTNKKETIFYEPQGCSQCEQGYQGRMGIYECVEMTSDLQDAFLQGASLSELKRCAQAQSYDTLLASGQRAVCEGWTSFSELKRVVAL